MLGDVMVYVVDCNEANKIGKAVGQDMSIEEFSEIAKRLNSAYTISEFIQKVNDEELQDLSNKFIRSCLIHDGLILEDF